MLPTGSLSILQCLSVEAHALQVLLYLSVEIQALQARVSQMGPVVY